MTLMHIETRERPIMIRPKIMNMSSLLVGVTSPEKSGYKTFLILPYPMVVKEQKKK